MTHVAYNPTYSEAQAEIFFDSAEQGRFRIFPKGRRLGATRGGAHAFIEWMLEGRQLLWGDTIYRNINAYVERYFIPALKADGIKYDWAQQRGTLYVGRGYTDFRSADNPMAWEGFGYSIVFLNEAGIILQGENGRYLYQNAVLPMLLDFKDAQLIAAGAPKGRTGLFFDLYQKAVAQEKGYFGKRYSSYDNPWLDRQEVARLEDDMRTLGGQPLVDQEIFGQFVDGGTDELRVIPYAWVQLAMERWKARTRPTGAPDALGVDVARGGRDKTVLSPRWGTYFGEMKSYPGSSTPDGPTVAALVVGSGIAPSTQVNVDIVGVGTSPFDHIQASHQKTFAINGAARSEGKDVTGNLSFRNLRAEMYWRFREALDPERGEDLALPPDEEMAQDLTAPTWKLSASGIQVESKDDIIKRLGRSPDKGDAAVLSHYVAPETIRRPAKHAVS